MKKIIIPIFLMMLLCVMTSCPDSYYHVEYYFKNKSNDTIYILKGSGGVSGSIYPDTMLPNKRIGGGAYPHSGTTCFLTGRSFEQAFKQFFKNDTAWIALVSADTINKYGWDDVRANYRVMVRYDLSYQDFMTLNREITYPPSPAMADMKMYPPYEEVIKRK